MLPLVRQFKYTAPWCQLRAAPCWVTLTILLSHRLLLQTWRHPTKPEVHNVSQQCRKRAEHGWMQQAQKLVKFRPLVSEMSSRTHTHAAADHYCVSVSTWQWAVMSSISQMSVALSCLVFNRPWFEGDHLPSWSVFSWSQLNQSIW